MLALLQTLFDIIRLRKGPDSIPYSWLVFVLVAALWLIAGLATTTMTEELNERDFLMGIVTGFAGLGLYALLVTISGHAPRLLQMTTAILGCGAVLSFLFVIGNLALTPFLSEGMVSMIVTLVLLWSIPVEGHIVARSIDRHWYVGIVAAMAVFIFQLFLYSLLNPQTGAVA